MNDLESAIKKFIEKVKFGSKYIFRFDNSNTFFAIEKVEESYCIFFKNIRYKIIFNGEIICEVYFDDEYDSYIFDYIRRCLISEIPTDEDLDLFHKKIIESEYKENTLKYKFKEKRNSNNNKE